jgi:predicted DNA repair protein MutK
VRAARGLTTFFQNVGTRFTLAAQNLSMPSGFFALLDDVAATMDDVASMTKVATQKTAGILGDDLAVNAEKAMGFSSSRELPVLWRIAKGSLLNKAIILPLAFVLDAWLPWFIEWVLVAGGAFLAFEGAEKVSHTWHAFRSKSKDRKLDKGSGMPDEAQRVRSAILVDFILSVEIVILAMTSVQETGWEMRLAVVGLVALLATVGVYGLVALIVRMDDMGLWLIQRGHALGKAIGRGLVLSLPWVVKVIGAFGTVALFVVSGGIFHHHLPWFHPWMHLWGLPTMLLDAVLGLLAGAAMLWLLHGAQAAWSWGKGRNG